MNEFKGSYDASGKRYGIVVARFNETYTKQLLEGAVDHLLRLGAESDDIDIYWVPGSYEVPGLAHQVAMEGEVDAIICLGVLIRGETSHYDLVANQVSAGIAEVFTEHGIPAIFAVVTAENQEQAQARCGGKMGNRGWDAAQAAVEMANLGDAFTGGDEEDFEEEAETAGAGEEPESKTAAVTRKVNAELENLINEKTK